MKYSQHIKYIVSQFNSNRFLAAIVIFYVLSVIWGAYRFYLPIPRGDMWDGYLDFYIRLLAGDTSAWWGQHNEHRIIFSRVLFFLDLKYFGGLSILLIPINVLFVFLNWFMVIKFANVLVYKRISKNVFFYLFVLITVFIFSWKQDENIIWAFQSQFWAVYLFPMLAFYQLSKASESRFEARYFIAAYCLGILSAGTMVNGVLVLPVLFCMGLILRLNRYYLATLLITSVVLIFLYFSGFNTPDGHVSVIDNIIESHYKIIIFFVEHMGSVLKNRYLSFIMGMLHLYFIVHIILNFKQIRKTPVAVAACGFILYYLFSAAVVSVARVNIGIDAALVGRYSTPTILSFLLTLILFIHIHPDRIRYLNKSVITIIAVLMLGTQARVLIKNVDKIQDREYLQILSLELGIYPDSKMQQVADKATRQDIAVFGIEPFVARREKLGKILDADRCHSVKISTPQSPALLPFYKPTPVTSNDEIPFSQLVYITDAENITIGYGLPSREYEHVIYLVNANKNTIPIKDTKLFTCH